MPKQQVALSHLYTKAFGANQKPGESNLRNNSISGEMIQNMIYAMVKDGVRMRQNMIILKILCHEI